MKQRIRINENQLKQIVTESVKRVLNEGWPHQDSFCGMVGLSQDKLVDVLYNWASIPEYKKASKALDRMLLDANPQIRSCIYYKTKNGFTDYDGNPIGR